jgi:hypothetical protein
MSSIRSIDLYIHRFIDLNNLLSCDKLSHWPEHTIIVVQLFNNYRSKIGLSDSRYM